MTIDEQRLAEIEAALATPGVSGVPLMCVADLCETIRAEWGGRDRQRSVFLLFAGGYYYPHGGAGDYAGTYPTAAAAQAAGYRLRAELLTLRDRDDNDIDWMEIVAVLPTSLSTVWRWSARKGSEWMSENSLAVGSRHATRSVTTFDATPSERST